MHEALVSLMRHRGDAQWVPESMYELVAPQANQLFHFLAYGLSFVVRTDLACKLVVAAILVGTPVFMGRLLRSLRLSAWPSLLVTPIVCGWMFTWGLVANMLGFALLLLFLPLAERLARKPGPAMAAWGICAAVLLFLAHESSALLFAMVVTFGLFVRSRRPRALLWHVLPVLAVLVLAALQWRLSDSLLGASMRAIGNDYGDDPISRLGMVPGGLFGGLGTTRLWILGTVWITGLVASAVAKGRGVRSLPLRVALWRHRYAMFAAAFFFLFLVFPMSLGGTTLLAHRFLPAACLGLIVACAAPLLDLPRKALLAVVPVTVVAVQMKNYVQADRNYRDLQEMIARLPQNVAVAQLDLTPMRPGRAAPVHGASNRVLAERGGRMLFAMTDMPPNPIYVRREWQWNEAVLRLVNSPYAFMPSHDLTRFSYLLAFNRRADLRQLVQKALEPEAELVASKGDWELYRSTLPTVSLNSPDVLLPSPAPEMLADRVKRVHGDSVRSR